jgi:hypothetical protein
MLLSGVLAVTITGDMTGHRGLSVILSTSMISILWMKKKLGKKFEQIRQAIYLLYLNEDLTT